MIYMHGKNGEIINKYDHFSGINIILEYACDGELRNYEIDKSKKRHIQVACQSMDYARNWIEVHEYAGKVCGDKFMPFYPVSCISIYVGEYKWWMRKTIEIEWNNNCDYHFYYDKDYEQKYISK